MRIIARKRKGFSLIELMSTIAIIGIMSGIAFVSFNSSKSSAKLGAAQREVAAAIKLTQSYALQGKMENTGGEWAVPCGYGFHFTDEENYEIFYNPGPEKCAEKNSGEDSYGKDYLHYLNSVSQTAELGSLKDGVRLSSPLVFKDTETYFTTPSARMFDWKGDLVADLITLEFQDPAENTKTIIINPSGSISEE